MLSTGGAYGFEVAGPSALVYCQFVDVAGIPTLLDTAVAFVRNVPDVVTHTAGARGPTDPTDAPSAVAALAEAEEQAIRQQEGDREA